MIFKGHAVSLLRRALIDGQVKKWKKRALKAILNSDDNDSIEGI